MVYLGIALWAAAGIMPAPTLTALLTLPLTIKAINGAWHSLDRSRLISAVGMHVVVVLLTQVLIAFGCIIG